MFQWMSKRLNQKRKGFTLIELVVVIAILGLLAALAIPRLTGQRERAAKTTHNANVRTIESAVSIYQAQYGEMPANIEALYASNLLKSEPEVPDGVFEGNIYDAYEANGGIVTPGPVELN